RYILFRIRNNTPRSISHIYAWIYKYRDLGRAGKKDYVLVNNPHQGGQVLKGPHAPGTVKEWRFSLRKDLPLPEKNEKFTLRVQPGAIFYHSLEPS
ncbi:MAG: hypothetical protein GWM98_30465, partial [Nitrospinaceae bacterium]|nr:hypothetical protein [Nitrospinaceae bacterium]NIR57994.1 hypothetical protein [Nitrospinaceae bacterium]NIS88456.1 hypothetical protein [Nitrospinaceae bacterium]NIT85336.1 hypothetical protein [Nitrospinaceae bacterium]NIU47487.1 hypothetical protein [Nitrospinaceae bacterium]